MDSLLESAEHWERLADESESQAKWDRDHDIDLSEPGQSAGDHQARTFRLVARTLRLEHATGEPHCHCHETPIRLCPSSGMGVRVPGVNS